MLKKPKILAMSTTKGGSGKSSSVINIARCIHKLYPDKKILVIDTDAQGNASQSVLLDEAEYYEHNLAQLFIGMMNGQEITIEDIIPCIYETSKVTTYIRDGEEVEEIEPYGFHILPCTIELQVLEAFGAYDENNQNTRKGIKKETVLSEIISMISRYIDYDYIMIDCPPNMGLFTYNALMAADYVLIPTGIGTFALRGIEYTMILTNQLAKHRNHKVECLGIISPLYNSKEGKKGLAANFTDEKIFYDFPFTEKFLTNIPFTIKAENTLIEGNLICETDKKVGKAYMDVAREFVWRLDNLDKLNEERMKKLTLMERIYKIMVYMGEMEVEDIPLGKTVDELNETDLDLENFSEEELLQEKERLLNEIKKLEDIRREAVFHGA